MWDSHPWSYRDHTHTKSYLISHWNTFRIYESPNNYDVDFCQLLLEQVLTLASNKNSSDTY